MNDVKMEAYERHQEPEAEALPPIDLVSEKQLPRVTLIGDGKCLPSAQ